MPPRVTLCAACAGTSAAHYPRCPRAQQLAKERRARIGEGVKRAHARREREKTEAQIQHDFITKCRAIGWDAWKIVSPENAGKPDTVVLGTDKRGRGVPAFVELKKPGCEPSALQEDCLNDLRRRGFIAGWADNADEAIARLIEAFRKRRVWL